MSRYIDAEPLDKEISSWITDDRGGNLDNDEIVFNETLVDCLEAISKQPTADVVPVVRCRDCKHKRMVLKSGCLGCDIQCGLHPYDWYCPNGEKVTK